MLYAAHTVVLEALLAAFTHFLPFQGGHVLMLLVFLQYTVDYDYMTDTYPFSPTIVTTGIGFLLHPPISTHTELPESTRGAIHQH